MKGRARPRSLGTDTRIHRRSLRCRHPGRPRASRCIRRHSRRLPTRPNSPGEPGLASPETPRGSRALAAGGIRQRGAQARPIHHAQRVAMGRPPIRRHEVSWEAWDVPPAVGAQLAVGQPERHLKRSQLLLSCYERQLMVHHQLIEGLGRPSLKCQHHLQSGHPRLGRPQ